MAAPRAGEDRRWRPGFRCAPDVPGEPRMPRVGLVDRPLGLYAAEVGPQDHPEEVKREEPR